MFDVFYLEDAPGLLAHEQLADSIEHAIALSRTRYLWVINSCNDYSNFDWAWEPVPWERNQAHVWPSQHQQNGGTWLIPKHGYEHVNRNHATIHRKFSAPRLHIKHSAHSDDQGQSSTRYISDYLGTMSRALKKTNWQFCWVTSDVCDYTNFDFTWHPSEWQIEMLHVFASNNQKFGDTFFVHVPSFLQKTKNLKILEWFETLHFVEDIQVPRFDPLQIQFDTDSVVPAIWQHDFTTPVVQFYNDCPVSNPPTMNLWQEQTKTVMPLSKGAACVLVPRECKNHIKTQVYDYPYIDKTHSSKSSKPLDVVFISNGEHGADHHWNVLNESLAGCMNQVHRIDGINGRVAAYQAAAKVSETAWFLAVFAKLQVNQDFDWSWQPDRMQEAKHYIFHAYNPVNHLVYGHQAMIAYNVKLVMANQGQGLDFTLDDPHEVVPIVSGTSYYDNDPWTCWRTAFRECIKLRHSLPDVENEYRLGQWLSQGDGVNGHWSMRGAQDAVDYYDGVKGDFAEIKKSYEWSWLAAYAMIVQPELVTQSRT